MYSTNKTQSMFHQEIETSLLEFVEHGNKSLLLERLKFYNDMEQLIKKHNTEYFVRLLDSENDSIQFEISINSFL